jgi:hypothetical protein
MIISDRLLPGQEQVSRRKDYVILPFIMSTKGAGELSLPLFVHRLKIAIYGGT